MNKWIRRIFCLHLNWHEAPAWEQDNWWRLGKKVWKCNNCGKKKTFDITGIGPVQFIPNNEPGE